MSAVEQEVPGNVKVLKSVCRSCHGGCSTLMHVKDGKLTKVEGDLVFPDEYQKIKKYYRFRGQFDVQLFPSLFFVENNGRGGIAFGKCRVVSP